MQLVGWHRAVLSLMAPVLLTTACGSAPAPLPVRATPTPVSLESPTAGGRLHVQPLTTITRTQQVQSLWVWGSGRFIAWAEGPSNAPVIVLYDRTTGQTRTLLRGSPTANFFPVRGEGNTVVTLEEAVMPNDAQTQTAWKIETVDVATGHVAVVRQSARPTSGMVLPYPQFDGRWIVWDEAQGDTVETTALMSYDVQTGRTFTLATKVPYAGPSVRDGVVYYREQQPSGAADIYRIAADGSTPAVQLTRNGMVGGVVARNGGLAWNQPPTGDARSLWYMPYGAGTPTKVVAQGDEAFPGDGFIVFAVPPDYGQLLAAPAAQAPASSVVIDATPPSQLARWCVDEGIVVWAERHASGSSPSTLIRVAQVQS
jgi:hypothetical protein